MDIELILKIAAVGIIVAVLSILLENAQRKEQALMITIAGVVVVLMIMINEIGALFDTIKSVFGLY